MKIRLRCSYIQMTLRAICTSISFPPFRSPEGEDALAAQAAERNGHRARLFQKGRSLAAWATHSDRRGGRVFDPSRPLIPEERASCPRGQPCRPETKLGCSLGTAVRRTHCRQKGVVKAQPNVDDIRHCVSMVGTWPGMPRLRPSLVQWATDLDPLRRLQHVRSKERVCRNHYVQSAGKALVASSVRADGDDAVLSS